MPLLLITISAATSTVQPQVEGRRSAWREVERSSVVAGRRQKYTTSAAPPVAINAIRICASAPGWLLLGRAADRVGRQPATLGLRIGTADHDRAVEPPEQPGDQAQAEQGDDGDAQVDEETRQRGTGARRGRGRRYRGRGRKPGRKRTSGTCVQGAKAGAPPRAPAVSRLCVRCPGSRPSTHSPR